MGYSTLLEDLHGLLDRGDPECRKWFLVRNNYTPFMLCSIYVLFIKVCGPMIMKNRRPMELRNPMMIYNFLLVATYLTCVTNILYTMSVIGVEFVCKPVSVMQDSHLYKMATYGWIAYLLKYIEFLDTVFFILRKKDHLITNLHVIHHFLLPIIGWFLLRTERSGFQVLPFLINCIVHIVMYTYYGLMAMGPKVRKYLWWKRYLTIAQMVQFILIVAFTTVIMPLSGCSGATSGVLIDIVGATFFFVLFHNFYQHTFKEKATNLEDNCDASYRVKENGKSEKKSF